MKYLAKILFHLLISIPLQIIPTSITSAAEHTLLFEYAIASYLDGGPYDFPIPGRKFIQIYNDGEAIFNNDYCYFKATISPESLEKLKLKLKTHPFLQEDRYIELDSKYMVSLHGGVCYIRYINDSAKTRIVATGVVPDHGKWKKLINLVESYFPPKSSLNYLEEISILVEKEGECSSGNKAIPDQWPLRQEWSLSNHEGAVILKEKDVIHYLFKNNYKNIFYYEKAFCENGVRYSLRIDGYPKLHSGENREDYVGAHAAQELKANYLNRNKTRK
jgi:hypothetical protein